MDLMVTTKRLRKTFKKTVAVKGLDLEVQTGDVVGLIGPNGAGKSTTLKMLATLLRPTAGDATVAGHSVSREPARVRRAIGYMPDVCGLYEEMLVHEYLRFFCSVYGTRGQKAEQIIDDVVSLTGLDGKINDACGGLSRGMSQRLHLARVLLHDPKLLLLDEPASGLDPRARIEFKDLVLTLKGMGKTLIISSHILSELGEMCDAIAVIEQSELVYQGPVEAAMDQVRDEGRIFDLVIMEEPSEGRTVADLGEVVGGFEYVDAVRDAEQAGALLVRFKPGFRDVYRLNQELVARGFRVERFAEQELRLEEAFLHITKGIVQ